MNFLSPPLQYPWQHRLSPASSPISELSLCGSLTRRPLTVNTMMTMLFPLFNYAPLSLEGYIKHCASRSVVRLSRICS